MKKLLENGSKAIAITLPKDEYDKFIANYRKTTCRGISARADSAGGRRGFTATTTFGSMNTGEDVQGMRKLLA